MVWVLAEASIRKTGWFPPTHDRRARCEAGKLACLGRSIDSNACVAYIGGVSTTLTIRNLDEGVKRKLRVQAASHQRSMEAEAREILAVAVNERPAATPRIAPPRTPEEMRERLRAVTGVWKDRASGKSTDEIMKELRGDE